MTSRTGFCLSRCHHDDCETVHGYNTHNIWLNGVSGGQKVEPRSKILQKSSALQLPTATPLPHETECRMYARAHLENAEECQLGCYTRFVHNRWLGSSLAATATAAQYKQPQGSALLPACNDHDP